MEPGVQRRQRLLDRGLSVLAVMGGLCLVVALAGPLLGVQVLFVRSGSMAPALPTGSLALAVTVEAADLDSGDVVSVTTPRGDRVTHRLVGVTPQGLVLQGDANDVPDAAPYPVERADRVLGHVPLAGYVLGWLSGPAGLLLLSLLGLGLLLVLMRPRVLVALGVSALVPLVVLGPGQVRSGWAAAWTDAATITGASYTAATVGAPVLTCTRSVGSVRFDWPAVTGATGYRLHYGAGGATTEVVGAGTTSRTIALVGSGRFWVVALRDFGAVTWESVPSNRKDYAITALVLASCTDA